MDERTREVFGQLMIDVLAKHHFRVIGRTDDNGWFTRDYFNGELGVELLYHLNDKGFSVMCPDELNAHYPISLIMRYFGESELECKSLEAQARFFDRYYSRIARMFGRRDGGAELEKYLRRSM